MASDHEFDQSVFFCRRCGIALEVAADAVEPPACFPGNVRSLVPEIAKARLRSVLEPVWERMRRAAKE